MYSRKIRTLIAGEISNMIGDCDGVYTCDVANELYNKDLYIIGTYQAREFLKEYFDDFMYCLEEYKDNFGESVADVTDSEKMASLLTLLVAENIINTLDCTSDIWDDELTESDIEMIVTQLTESYSL